MSKANISGHIRVRPNKANPRYYEAVVDLGIDPVSHKRNRVAFRAETEVEANELLIKKQAEYLNQEMLVPSKMTVEGYLKEYYQLYVEGCGKSPATVRDYQSVIKGYLIPAFGKIQLQKFNMRDIQLAYKEWRKQSPRAKGVQKNGLKAESIKHIHRVLKTALNKACDLEYIHRNPALKVSIPKDAEQNELDIYTLDEVKALQKAVKDTDMELPVALLLDCLMRRGELLGLKYTDINFDTREITIRNSLVETSDSKVSELKSCKTESSYRKLMVGKNTIRLLKKQHKLYKQNKLKEGKNFHDEGFVICQSNGKCFLPKSFTRKWTRTLQKNGLRHMKMHGTRHTGISMLLANGVPVHMVQQRAGHSTPDLTLSIYAHVAKDQEDIIADKIDALLYGNNG